MKYCITRQIFFRNIRLTDGSGYDARKFCVHGHVWVILYDLTNGLEFFVQIMRPNFTNPTFFICSWAGRCTSHSTVTVGHPHMNSCGAHGLAMILIILL